MAKLLILLAAAILVGAAAVLLGPREPVVLDPRISAADLPEDLPGWLARREAGVSPDTAARIVWADEPGVQTDIAVVYLHGFSATLQEIRPVPDQVAAALGANLFYARLSGHGRDGAAMAAPAVQDWVDDTAVALAIGRRLGRKTLVIATSTGGTLAAEAARNPDLSGQVDAVVLISPNFALLNPAARLLTLGFARQWLPLIAGRERCFTPANDAHARFWTMCYPTRAVLPMAALAKHAGQGDYAAATMPALFMTSPEDQVVSPQASRAVADRWGGPVQWQQMKLGAGDDPSRHVLAGDILSPSMTAPVSEVITLWAREALSR